MNQISSSSKFERAYKKLVQRNPQLTKKMMKTVNLMKNDLDHPSLRLHKLAGYQIYSVSVDMSIRIIFHLKSDIIYLLNIGTHEEVY